MFSTNDQLLLTGGVGAALLDRFGEQFQDALLACVDGRDAASQGDVFHFQNTLTPWHHMFAVIAVDAAYHVEQKIVREILRDVLGMCSVNHDIRIVVMSALGF